jgi:transcriptional regulator with XRE-family HTH domain
MDSRLSPITTDAHPLVALRVRRGLSRERLAQLAGVSSRTVYGIERGGHEPRRATAVVLAAALDCDPGDLLKSNEAESACRARVLRVQPAVPPPTNLDLKS